MPADVTDAHANALRIAVRLLDGEEVEIADRVWRIGVVPERLAEFLDTFTDLQGGLLFAQADMEVTVGDLTLPYGPAARWAPLPRLRNRESLVALRDARPTPSDASAPAEIWAELEVVDHPFVWVARTTAESYFADEAESS
jgi:hypothetical protein